MTNTRRYRLLCPIGRALDRVGDRWTLLILRDLHAGPARFADLQTGLAGIAPNLLSDRLRQLTHDKLVVKRAGDHGVTLYALTELGARTRDLLFELAMFGGRFRPDEDVRKPGNLRNIAVTLSGACQRAVTPDMQFEAELNIDREFFSLVVGQERVQITYGRANSPDVTLQTSYEPLIAAAEGEISMDQFVGNDIKLTTLTPGKEVELITLLGRALSVLGKGD